VLADDIAVGPESFPFTRPRTLYDDWAERQEIPIYRCQYARNLGTLPVAPWPRKGVNGAFIHHAETSESNDSYLCQIPPGGQTTPQRHLYQETIYVLSGRGATAVWLEPDQKVTFEWQEGSLFAIPINTWHQHFNGQGGQPARYIGETNAPVMFNTFKEEEFVLENPYRFKRFDGRSDFFSGAGRKIGKVWETNFVTDARDIGLMDHPKRGAGGANMKFALAGNSMGCHSSEFDVGTYKKAHWHGPGAHVIILSGVGYSLMWPDGAEPRRFDWQPGTLLIPPGGWFHQHFNVGAERARYLALRFHGTAATEKELDQATRADRKLGGNQIEYEDELPMIREMYLAALRERGIQHRMEKYWPSGVG